MKGQERLTICIQNNDGRIGQKSLDLLSAADFQFQQDERVDICEVENFPLTIEFSRNVDISDDVRRGFCDFGVVGTDRIAEAGVNVIPLLPLGFGQCKLQLGVRNDISYTNLANLRNLTVVTSYPNLTRQFFGTIPFDLLVRAGKVEKYVKKGRAQACIDITSSGRSMRNNGIEPYDILLESQATLIAGPLLKQQRGKERLAEDFLISIVSAIQARDFILMSMNAPDTVRNAITAILPSEEAPTISPLAKQDWCAISSVVLRNDFRKLRAQLQAIGAKGILGSLQEQVSPNRDDRDIMRMMEKIYD